MSGEKEPERKPERKPDWVGAWDCSHFQDLTEYFEFAGGNQPVPGGNHFQLFMLDRHGGVFSGTSLDHYGVADITGIETDEILTFTKQYRPEAQSKGASRSVLHYRAVKLESLAAATDKGCSELASGMITAPVAAARTFIMRKLK
jgi:hypothetical protein